MIHLSGRLPALLLVCSLCALSSCVQQTVNQDSQAIPVGGWKHNHKISFEVELSDTLSLHELYIMVRNTTDYPYSNFYLFLDIEFPDQRTLRDTLECVLAHRDGQWTGKGFGKIRSNQFMFRDDVWFPVSGTYSFRLQHGMRDEPLQGISDIGIRIDRK